MKKGKSYLKDKNTESIRIEYYDNSTQVCRLLVQKNSGMR